MLQTALNKKVEMLPLDATPELQSQEVYVDQKHFQQILINLMSNAVKYTPPGGKVWLETTVRGDKFEVVVCDSGVGIPKSKAEKLFERFERGEDAYSKAQVGTGIGLNLTKRLVELNGGRIGFESEEGKGSRFWVLVPLAELGQSSGIEQTKESNRQRRLQRLDGLSTLVLDDNADTCEVLRLTLGAAGAAVQTANSVPDARKLLESGAIDVVLTDLAIPGESGLDLIKYVRALAGSQSEVPIIVLSACAFESDKQAALDAGASVFIPKPFQPSDVVGMVRQLTLESALGD
jgi:CheY-like chemotaxis protein